MTVIVRTAAEAPILDPVDLDNYLVAHQEAFTRKRELLSENAEFALAIRHGMATDLRELIADWLAESCCTTREDADLAAIGEDDYV